MTLENLLNRDGIRHTVSLYYSAVDRGEYEELEYVFTENASMTLTGQTTFEGRKNIISALSSGANQRRAFEPGNFQRHFLGNAVISLIADRNARAVHYALVMTELGIDHSAVTVDDFLKVGDRWLFSRLSGNIEWVRPDSIFNLFPGRAEPFVIKETDFKFPARFTQ